MVRLLAVSGSLRAASSNSSLLRAAEKLSPQGMSIQHYLEVGQLPHFDPDLADSPPAIVLALRELIGRADGILISCPEYARGIPGSFKNAGLARRQPRISRQAGGAVQCLAAGESCPGGAQVGVGNDVSQYRRTGIDYCKPAGQGNG